MTPLRVLIAEDDPILAEGLRARLTALGHTVVAITYDGRDAVVQAGALTPDLAFLDIKMPRLDGLQATHQIMAARPIPIILLTAHSDPALKARADLAGVAGYLVKPVDDQDLRAGIALAVRRFADQSREGMCRAVPDLPAE
jgi:response regulator NasT